MGKINLVTLPTEKLVEMAYEKGIENPADMKRADLIDALKAASPDDEKADAPKPGKLVFYWIKVPTYATDTDIWPLGVYRTAPNERLDRSLPAYVERFDSTIPEGVLFEIAKQLKVSIETGQGKRTFRNADEILEEIVIDR